MNANLEDETSATDGGEQQMRIFQMTGGNKHVGG